MTPKRFRVVPEPNLNVSVIQIMYGRICDSGDDVHARSEDAIRGRALMNRGPIDLQFAVPGRGPGDKEAAGPIGSCVLPIRLLSPHFSSRLTPCSVFSVDCAYMSRKSRYARTCLEGGT